MDKNKALGKVRTGDDCVSCGETGMVFYVSRLIPGPDSIGEYAIGMLSCPTCGAESPAIQKDYMGESRGK